MTSDLDRSVSATAPKDNRPAPPAGFAAPNYTQVPNCFLDNWLPELTGAETKVLLYMIRRTLGFHRNSERIGLRQICNGMPGKDRGTGLHVETAHRAVASLEKKQLLKPRRNGKRRTWYQLNIWIPNPEAEAEVFGKSEQLEETPPNQTVRKIRTAVFGKSEQLCTENPNTQKKGNTGKKVTSSSAPPADLARACREVLPRIDDDAVRTLWMECRKNAPDCTPEEVADTFQTKAAQILRGKGVRNPVGLMLAAVPKCFEGDTTRRPPKMAAKPQPEAFNPANVRMWLEAVKDPNESAELREIAAEALAEARSTNPEMVAQLEREMQERELRKRKA